MLLLEHLMASYIIKEILLRNTKVFIIGGLNYIMFNNIIFSIIV